MESSDAPLMKAWAPQAVELFADELQELELMRSADQQAFSISLEQARAQALTEEEAVRRHNAMLVASTKGRRAKGKKHGEEHSAAAGPPTLDSFVEERVSEVRRRRENQVWVQMVRLCEQEIQQTQRTAVMVQKQEIASHTAFCSRDLDQFTMKDILALAEQSNFNSTVQNLYVSSAPSIRATAQPEVSGEDSQSSHSAVGLFLIDAIGFVTQYNEMLLQQYGYQLDDVSTCVAIPPKSSTDEPVPGDVLQNLLSTHRPGLGMDSTPFCVQPAFSRTRPGDRGMTGRSALEATPSKVLAALTGRAQSTRRVTSPPLSADRCFASPSSRLSPLSYKHTASGYAGGGHRTFPAKHTPHDVSAKMSNTARSANNKTSGIECSVKDKLISLSTTARTEVRYTVRFTNLNSFRMRLRLRPSTHPWIKFTCVHLASVDGGSGRRVGVETPLSCGGYLVVEITFVPPNFSKPLIEEVLQVGAARELNSRSGEGAQWSFTDVLVRCETIPPVPRLSRLVENDDVSVAGRVSVPAGGGHSAVSLKRKKGRDAKMQSLSLKQPIPAPQFLSACNFPFTFVMGTTTTLYQLSNPGSTAVVTLSSSSPEFNVDPAPDTSTLLSSGDTMVVSVSFSPVNIGSCEGKLVVTVREEEGGAVFSEHDFALRGDGIAPEVYITRIGVSEAVHNGGSHRHFDEIDGALRYVADGTVPGVPTSVPVTVYSSTPVPLPFHWSGEVANAGNNGMACNVAISPSHGTLEPNQMTTFLVTFTPQSTEPLMTSWNLFLEDLPDPRNASMTAVAAAPSSVVALLSRNKLIPSAALSVQELSTTGESVTGSPDAYMDPFSVFRPCNVMQPEGQSATFMTGFFLFAQPIVPQLTMLPSYLEEMTDCLREATNVRHVTLRNHSSIPLHFCLDPNASECKEVGSWIAPISPKKREVTVKCSPRKGLIKPLSEMVVTVCFTIHTVGHHFFAIGCLVPEIMRYVSPGSPYSHKLSVRATSVGPSLRTSVDMLDFGLIELGKESEASFTVMNDNPITVVCDIRDSTVDERSRRFTFRPATIRLAAGASALVTVCRKAVCCEDTAGVIEIAVHDGGTTLIETRSVIQAATMMLEETVVDYGVVPDGVWQERHFFLSNTTALDVPYELHVATPSDSVLLEFPASGVLPAGHTHVGVVLRACFVFNPAESTSRSCYRSLLAIRSQRTPQMLLVEVTCAAVEQLRVSLDIVSAEGAIVSDIRDKEARCTANTVTVPLQRSPMPVTSYVHALLWNELEDRLWSLLGLEGATDEKPLQLRRPYCSPLTLLVFLPNDSPICTSQLLLLVENHTGCESSYRLEATYFAASVTAPALGEGTGSKTVLQATGENELEGTSSVDAVEARSAFWTTAENGVEIAERARRTALAGAQRNLLDGRGCFTVLPAASTGPLGPYAKVQLPVTMQSNLPGRYDEKIRVCCGALPSVDLPVSIEVRGSPLLLDPTTPGLTTVDCHNVLIMPSVIAVVGTSSRNLRLLNRIPRDIDVSVDVFLCSSSFEVAAIDVGADAAQVVLKLVPLSASTEQRETGGKSHASVQPSSFFIPAMGSMEIVVQYSPGRDVITSVMSELLKTEATECASGEGESRDTFPCQEVDWKGNLTIRAQIASSTFNDAFLIDEFYRLNAARYPSTSVLRQQQMGRQCGETWKKSILRPVSFLEVSRPLRTRQGVVYNNKFQNPSEGEKRLLGATRHNPERFSPPAEHDSASLSGGASQPSASSHSGTSFHANAIPAGSEGNAAAESDSGSDDDNQGGVGHMMPIVDALDGPAKPLPVLLAEDAERQELLAYLERRRAEVRSESIHCFTPIELALRSRCGVPRLAVQPSMRGVVFTGITAGTSCSQTIRLTNYNSAALFFTLHVTSFELFRMVGVSMVPADVEEDLLSEDDEEGRRTRQAVRDLKWQSKHDQSAAMRLTMGATGAKTGGGKTLPVVAGYASHPVHGEDQPVYKLRCADALDVIVEYVGRNCDDMEATCLSHHSSGEGALHIEYVNSLTVANRKGAGDKSNAVSCSGSRTPQPPSVSLRESDEIGHQMVPLRVRFCLPKVQCQPTLLWFRPGQLMHDGRPQPAYQQKLTLCNTTELAVRYEVIFVPRSAQSLSDTSPSALIGAKSLLDRERKIAEVTRMPSSLAPPSGEGVLVVDDAAPFTVTPLTGVLPPASAGGQPSRTTLQVQFDEHSNVRFECLYSVLLNGEPSDVSFLLRGDSREVEL